MMKTILALMIASVLQVGNPVEVLLGGGQTGLMKIIGTVGYSIELFCLVGPTVSKQGTPKLQWTYSKTIDGPTTELVSNWTVAKGINDMVITNPYNLGITTLKQNHTGFYNCRGWIDGDNPPSASGTYDIRVLSSPGPVTAEYPIYRSMTVGKSASFYCREGNPRGYPAPTFAWHRGGSMLPHTSTGQSSANYSADEGTLRFYSVVADDAGMYSCEATNPMGSSMTSNEYISVSLTDDFQVFPTKHTVVHQSSSTVSFVAIGTAAAVVIVVLFVIWLFIG